MIPPRRRGVCPTLADPMETGDGLLARLTPTGATIPLGALAGIAAAARRHGNGIIEVTARGSIQARGLTPGSAPAFADAIAALDIPLNEGVPVAVNPLAGLENDEIIDAGALGREVRARLLRAGLAARLAPKVSVAIDGGGALHLDAVAADVRLRARLSGDDPRLDVFVGGDAASAVNIGAVALEHAAEAALRLLTALAGRGGAPRARDLLSQGGAAAFRTTIADLLLPGDELALPRSPTEPVGRFPLRDGTVALGIGLAFGHADADAIERLADAGAKAGASGLRTAPDRALLLVGVKPDRAEALAAIADSLGFVTRAGDPRRSVAVCAGAPLCASAGLPTRGLAPSAAAAIAAMLDGSLDLHLSGCVKSCAHPGAAAITVVGMQEGCGIIIDGGTREPPLVTVPAEALMAAFARLAQAVADGLREGESAREALVRLGAARIAEVLKERPHG